jgi:hypothetical protein
MYKFGITARTAYRDLARLAHLLDQVSPGRYRLSTHLLPTLHTGHLAEFADFAGVAHLSLVGTDSRYVTA